MKKHQLFKLMGFWPPFLGAGVSVDYVASDYSKILVSMKLKFWNKNYVNTHFGGSLYSMTDPFYMLMLMERLGPNYIVWDKAASIDFKRPGKGKVFATFEISDEKIASIIKDAESGEKIFPVFTVNVVDAEKNIICSVEKTLYIKKRPANNLAGHLLKLLKEIS